jgi:hypothetical protein
MSKSTTVTVPAPPAISATEEKINQATLEALNTQNKLLSESATQGAEQQSIYKSLSGLYDENGNLDQNALASMKTKNAAYQAQADEISSLQTERYLNGRYAGRCHGAFKCRHSKSRELQSDFWTSGRSGTKGRACLWWYRIRPFRQRP